ncbi:restriction endonuclease subunit S [Azospirillum thiophilum]|nr:restriction endonuclease subunit S [Azospirillum thiophilum]
MTYPRYTDTKDSGMAWLGEMPSHWSLVSIKALYRFVKRQDNADAPVLSVYREYGVIEKSSRSDNNNKTPDDLSLYQTVLEDDLVINKMKAWQGSLGVSKIHGITSPDYAVFEKIHSEVSGYLHNLLRSNAMPSVYRLISNGIRNEQWRLEPDKFLQIKVPLPPHTEQNAIVAFLDRETAKIDALVAEQERLIELLKEKRQAVISHAVTKGLNPDAPMKDSGIEWLGKIPMNWRIVRLKFVAEVQGGVAKGREIENSDAIDVPYLRVTNVQDGYLDLDDIATIQIESRELERFLLKNGDVLMNEGGDFDKLGRGHIWKGEIENCIHQNHVFAVRPKYIESEWLNLQTSADYGRFYFMSRSKQSTNLASISSTNICEFPMICPPPTDRAILVKHVYKETVKLDTLITEAQRAIDLLKERRAALISAAVTGQIDVRGLVESEAAA